MMRLIRLLSPLLCAVALAVTPAAASVAAPATAVTSPDIPTQQAAMDRLSFMVGNWVGSGWTITASGTRQEFLQTERVRRQVQGLVISVEGLGRDKADPTRIVDSALAVINYDDTTSQYRWEAFSQGHLTASVPVVGDDTFQWTLSQPGVTIRYTLKFTRTSWHEVGELSTDGGQSWRKNFQMDLTRLR